jgi:hypothetical protein
MVEVPNNINLMSLVFTVEFRTHGNLNNYPGTPMIGYQW